MKVASSLLLALPKALRRFNPKNILFVLRNNAEHLTHALSHMFELLIEAFRVRLEEVGSYELDACSGADGFASVVGDSGSLVFESSFRQAAGCDNPDAEAQRIKVFEVTQESGEEYLENKTLFWSCGRLFKEICLTEAQITTFCRKNHDLLSRAGNRTCFLLKKAEKYFVCSVSLRNTVCSEGQLCIHVTELGYECQERRYVCHDLYRLQVVIAT